MGLQRFERRLERLVEGGFGKAFRSGLQPVEIGRRLVREFDRAVRSALRHRRPQSFRRVRRRRRFRAVRGLPRCAPSTPSAKPCVTAPARPTITSSGPSRWKLVADPAAGGRRSRHRRRDRGGCERARPARRARRRPAHRSRDDPVQIGRLPDCAIALSDSQVSRHHAEVRRSPHGFEVVDLELAQRHHGQRRQSPGAHAGRRRRDQRGNTSIRYEES